MKPVQLLPSHSPVVSAKLDAKPNYGLIGGIAVAIVALVGVGGFFAMARVDTVNSATEKMAADTAAAQAEAAKSQATIASLGQPVVNKDIKISEDAESVLVGAYGERREFELMAQELDKAMRGTGGWYTKIVASSTGGASDASEAAVEIIGYMPVAELATGFDERIDSTKTLSKADLVSVKTELLKDSSGKVVEYWMFTIHAELAGVDGVSGADTSTLVGDGGLELTVESEPTRAKPVKAKATPKNPFDIAASKAGGAS